MPSVDQSPDRSVGDTELELAIICALDECRVIGDDGDLPWRLPADLRHFKETTMGCPIIMGRRTQESIGTALPGRTNIVLSRQPEFKARGCTVAHTFDEALRYADEAEGRRAMIIGGQSLFRRAIPLAQRMSLTLVCGRHRGDTFFPGFESADWEVVDRKFHGADDEHKEAMVFVELRSVSSDQNAVFETTERGPLPLVLRRQLDWARSSK